MTFSLIPYLPGSQPGAATNQFEYGLAEMATNVSAVSESTNWPWINAIMNKAPGTGMCRAISGI
jgi:hypothetical protein